ncbi:MAG: GNAT family N-acetyltransferase [Chloroflexota bacterium]
MPSIEVRPAISTDVQWLIAMDHSYTTEYVWQMEEEVDNSQVTVTFREVRLPRSVRVGYPRRTAKLEDDWQQRSALLVAVLEGMVVGYASLMEGVAPESVWVTDLAVVSAQRRRGVGTALLLASQKWAEQMKKKRLVLEMQSKNHPAIRLAQKLGYEFCGFSDHYYPNQDIALFFSRLLR